MDMVPLVQFSSCWRICLKCPRVGLAYVEFRVSHISADVVVVERIGWIDVVIVPKRPLYMSLSWCFQRVKSLLGMIPASVVSVAGGIATDPSMYPARS